MGGEIPLPRPTIQPTGAPPNRGRVKTSPATPDNRPAGREANRMGRLKPGGSAPSKFAEPHLLPGEPRGGVQSGSRQPRGRTRRGEAGSGRARGVLAGRRLQGFIPKVGGKKPGKQNSGRASLSLSLSPAGRYLARRRPVRTGSALSMLRGNPLPAMRWTLRWLLLAGLLSSPPCGGKRPQRMEGWGRFGAVRCGEGEAGSKRGDPSFGCSRG